MGADSRNGDYKERTGVSEYEELHEQRIHRPRSRQQLVVIGVAADPKPDKPFWFLNRQGAIVFSDTN